ncbi:hypothetical protein D4S03_04645 [bacterium]|nr:MAG: hypothetical protein D4S03_04645 [bacterium]
MIQRRYTRMIACVNIGATGRSVIPREKVYIGSVSDDPYDIRTRIVVKRRPGVFSFVGTELVSVDPSVSDPEYMTMVKGAPSRGINEKGFSFTWTLTLEKAENKPPHRAMGPAELWANVLEGCGMVGDAIDLLASLPRGFAANGMLADRQGNLAAVEFGRKKFAVRERYSLQEGGTASNVNCWITMQEEEGDPLVSLNNPAVPNQARYYRAKELLASLDGRIDLTAMRQVLTDHVNRERFAGENPWIPGHGYSICNHGSLRTTHFEREKAGCGSVSAEILDPTAGVFWYAYGWPCGEPPQYGDELLQERSWGTFIGFPLSELPEGEYTTLSGELTPLACKHFHLLRPWNSAS